MDMRRRSMVMATETVLIQKMRHCVRPVEYSRLFMKRVVSNVCPVGSVNVDSRNIN